MTKSTRKTKPLRAVAAPEIIVRAARIPSTQLTLLRRRRRIEATKNGELS